MHKCIFSILATGALVLKQDYPDSKVHGANMGPIWGWQDPVGPHVGPINLVIWVGVVDTLQEALSIHSADQMSMYLTSVTQKYYIYWSNILGDKVIYLLKIPILQVKP